MNNHSENNKNDITMPTKTNIAELRNEDGSPLKRVPKTNEEIKWEDQYCKEFGLCTEKGKVYCQCKEELKFIRNLLSSQRTQIANKINEIQFEDGFSAREQQVIDQVLEIIKK